jgi:hypothetical protein
LNADKYESCVRQSAFNPRRLLAKEFCSDWWIGFSHVRRRDGHGRIVVCRKRGAYPTGDMVKCSDCGKWAPRRTSDTRCVDCRVESDDASFWHHVRRWPKRDRTEFLRRYWSRPQRTGEWLLTGMHRPKLRFDAVPSDEEDATDEDSLINEADLFNGELERDQTWGNAPSMHDMLEQLRSSFIEEITTKKGIKKKRLKRRGAGCHKVMLSESETALMNELAYYQRTGKIVPSARRLSNPFNKREKPLPMPGKPCGL